MESERSTQECSQYPKTRMIMHMCCLKVDSVLVVFLGQHCCYKLRVGDSRVYRSVEQWYLDGSMHKQQKHMDIQHLVSNSEQMDSITRQWTVDTHCRALQSTSRIQLPKQEIAPGALLSYLDAAYCLA
ncbi:unnamed protein product [Ambrosiozyma monospora]|uniref:Unnamed protein product n=1 Tax=Ambrosiozyma monospora TaxID=43982 RepID=A0A9W6T013_AMBMO|nr:unnamed protein product [Ambrosiozyma monospora]